MLGKRFFFPRLDVDQPQQPRDGRITPSLTWKVWLGCLGRTAKHGHVLYTKCIHIIMYNWTHLYKCIYIYNYIVYTLCALYIQNLLCIYIYIHWIHICTDNSKIRLKNSTTFFRNPPLKARKKEEQFLKQVPFELEII